ncbi:MAG: YSC84-related protein [Alphaproteobacteria bacterium]
MTVTRRHALGALAAITATAALSGSPARAAEAVAIDARVNLALGQLWSEVPSARDLASRAKAMLVMPDVIKAGLILGGAYGEGALRINDPVEGYEKVGGYYSVAAASVGLQIGVQSTSHVLFFMTDAALAKFRRADGWEVGVDAEVTFPEAGLNAGIDSTSFEKPVIGVVFAEDGLLVGASLAGAKYSPMLR